MDDTTDSAVADPLTGLETGVQKQTVTATENATPIPRKPAKRSTLTMSTRSGSTPRVNKLQGKDDFPRWADMLESLLRSEQLWGFVDSTSLKPQPTLRRNEEEYELEERIEAWEAKKYQARVLIIANCSQSIADTVRRIKHPTVYGTISSLYMDRPANQKNTCCIWTLNRQCPKIQKCYGVSRSDLLHKT